MTVKIFRIPSGHGITPKDVRFNRNKLYRAHIDEQGYAFISTIIAWMMRCEKKDARYISLPLVRNKAYELSRKRNLPYEGETVQDNFSLIEEVMKCRILFCFFGKWNK